MLRFLLLILPFLAFVSNAQEIKITGGDDVEIVDGDASPSLIDETDFGGAPVNGTVSKTFTIENTGGSTLTLSGSPLVSISGTNASDFSITTAPSSSISASSSTTFVVEFEAGALGVREAEITITNNDADEGTYSFSIQGVGVVESKPNLGAADQIGNEIEGAASGDLCGAAVAISADGKIIAIGSANNTNNSNTYAGHVRIFEWTGTSWDQMGNNIEGDNSFDEFGKALAFSNNGKILAIGAKKNDGNGTDAGHVKVFEWDEANSIWDQMGGDIEGESAGDWFGISVDLSGDATDLFLAVGAERNGGTGTDAGHIRVFNWTGSNWSQIGNDIDGEATGDRWGSTIALSFDGKTVAAGSRANSNNSGHARIFEWSGSSWVQMGDDLDGDNSGDYFGYSVDLSADGQQIAIGSPSDNNSNGINAGQAQVYKWTGINWTQKGAGINGDAKSDGLGFKVSLSNDGNCLATTAYKSDDGSTQDVGEVKIFEWSDSTWVQKGTDIKGENANDQFGQGISLSSDASMLVVGTGNYSPGGYAKVYSISLEPEIELKNSNDIEIEYGTTTTSLTDYTDFGGTAVGTSINNTYTIESIGRAALTLIGTTPVTISGANATDFSITTQPSSNIAAGNSSTFVVAFQPTAIGERTAQINIANNDANEGTYTFAIQGLGIIGSSATLGTASQHGTDIDGESAGDNYGWNVALSDDGLIMASGGSQNDDGGSNAGQARVFEWDVATSDWVQLGNDISGANAGDEFGRFIALSSDGKIVAVSALEANSAKGHVRVFEYDEVNDVWDQIGNTIEGEANNDQSGSDIDLSADGTILAIGAHQNDGNGSNAGHVRVYEWSGSAWVQLGDDIDGESSGDLSGTSVALSSNGKILAIGAPENDATANNAGQVRIFEWNGIAWIQLGADLDGAANSDQFGFAIDLSSDGRTLVSGSPKFDDGRGWPYTYNIGLNDVFTWNAASESWTQVGTSVMGEAKEDNSGWAVSISGDGKTFATGAVTNDGSFSDAGHVQIFGWSGTAWVQVGSDIDGEAQNDKSGTTVALSKDASLVAIGSRINYGNGASAGHVRIFNTEQPGELDIYGNSTEIDDGATEIAIGKHTNFGSVDATSGSKSRTFTLTNSSSTGTIRLEGASPVTVSGANAADFTITQPNSTVINPSSSITFQMSFDPSATGDRVAELSIASNDADEGTYNFAIGGLGSSKSNYPFEWTWHKGSTTNGASGVYGTKGTGSTNNLPGARNGGLTWSDGAGNFYLFGGEGVDGSGNSGLLNDLWQYNASSEEWTWLAGSSSRNAVGSYSGTEIPGARKGSHGFIDGSGNLWLQGGYGYNSSSTAGQLNDLWKWDGSAWSFEDGDNAINQEAVYGTTGTAAATNTPNGGSDAFTWYDANGSFWMFGGQGIDDNNSDGYLNGLWKYSNSQWTFMGGDKIKNQDGTFGSKGIANSANIPSSRINGASWTDENGDLWLFGGYGHDGNGDEKYLNDLWKYDVSADEWTWVSGNKDGDKTGVYGVQGEASASNYPGGREYSIYWKDADGNFTLYGGNGFDASNNSEGTLNDLWVWNGTQWTWTGGGNEKDLSGNYGTMGTSSSDNYSGSREDGQAWIDADGHLWLFGGNGIDGSSNSGNLNDLWQLELT